MSNIFLVDFENVSDSGLEGFLQLPAEDRVYVFYTEKAGKIGIGFFTDVCARETHAALSFVKARTGNQALDLQLGSFLGSLVVSEPEGTAFYIISKDKGYACLPPFWTELKEGVKIIQADRISTALNGGKKAASKAKTAEAAVPEQKEPAAVEEPVPPAQPDGEKKPVAKRQAAARKKASAKAQPAPAAPEVSAAPTVSEEPAPEPVLPEELKNSAPTKKLSSAERSTINDSAQVALSKAKFDADTVGNVTSLISKMTRGSKSRQELYLTIIKTYGQKKGLEIYNVIKPILK